MGEPLKITRLQVSGVKRLVAVDITPGPGMNRVGGFNGEGKSSLLDSIAMAFGGADMIPMKPLRTGEEYGVIRAEAGDLRVTRYFNDDGTTSLKVQSVDGATYDAGQKKLNHIIGAISFDPIKFADMDPKAQATELRRMVPLSVNLDELKKADSEDMAARRDINRDEKAKRAQAAGVEVSGIVPERPDRAAILSALSSAGDTNARIERERAARIERQQTINSRKSRVGELSAEIGRLEDRIAQIKGEIEMLDNGTAERERELSELPALPEPVDTAKLSDDLAAADRALALLARIDERKRLEGEADALKARSEALTKAMADRAELREKALSEAEMPIEGLSFATIKDEMVVTYNGEPFSQCSRAEQIRVSMRIAMAANPKLRVMTIRDGSLLDERGFKLISDIAAEGDYQVFVEVVGEGEENGIIIEDGRVKGAAEPEIVPPLKRRKPKTDDSEATGATETENPPEMSTDKADQSTGGTLFERMAASVKTPGSDAKFDQITGEPSAPRRRRPPSLSDLTGGGE